MNSSDEEKQLQLITTLKEQGRRARGRQVRAAAARGRGRLPGAGFGLRRGGRGAVAAAGLAPHAGASCTRPARLGEPGAERQVRGSGAWGPAVREALPARCRRWRSGLGEGVGIGGWTKTRGTPSHAGEAWLGSRWVARRRFGLLRWPCSPAAAPPLSRGAGRPAAELRSLSLLSSRPRSSSSLPLGPRFRALMCFTAFHF